MDIKVKNKDLMQEYRISDAEGRFNIMMDNYCIFPKIIRKMERRRSTGSNARRNTQEASTVASWVSAYRHPSSAIPLLRKLPLIS